jgi:hypothetical protein
MWALYHPGRVPNSVGEGLINGQLANHDARAGVTQGGSEI